MEIKLIEIRDRATFIPAMAVAFVASRSDNADYLLRRAGYAVGERYIILIKLTGGDVSATYDPYGWLGSSRTMPAAHQHIIDHWENITSGDVVDVEYILGEKPQPKTSERLVDMYDRS